MIEPYARFSTLVTANCIVKPTVAMASTAAVIRPKPNEDINTLKRIPYRDQSSPQLCIANNHRIASIISTSEPLLPMASAVVTADAALTDHGNDTHCRCHDQLTPNRNVSTDRLAATRSVCPRSRFPRRRCTGRPQTHQRRCGMRRSCRDRRPLHNESSCEPSGPRVLERTKSLPWPPEHRSESSRCHSCISPPSLTST